jgi:hypothetical protein
MPARVRRDALHEFAHCPFRIARRLLPLWDGRRELARELGLGRVLPWEAEATSASIFVAKSTARPREGRRDRRRPTPPRDCWLACHRCARSRRPASGRWCRPGIRGRPRPGAKAPGGLFALGASITNRIGGRQWEDVAMRRHDGAAARWRETGPPPVIARQRGVH